MSDYYDVIAVSSGDPSYEEMLREQGVRGYNVNMTRQITPLKDLVSLVKLIRLFRKEKPFIVHTHTPKAGTLGMLAAWITGVPNRLHTVAGLPLLVATGRKRKLLDFVEKITYACATNVYPNSFVMRDIILQNKLTTTSKVKVIGNGSSNGIDTAYFNPVRIYTGAKELKDTLHIPSDVFTFCFIGRLVKDKGINELVGAFIRLYDENKAIRLLIVGRFEKEIDPLLPETSERILHHEGIVFAGWQQDVRSYLAASDALVFPSYREGFPNVVMQAGAMGLPAIVTDINGCNEIIIEGKNGVIIPPKNEESLYKSMKDFAEQPNNVKRMASNARQLIESRYEQKMVWELILDEYRSLPEK